MHFLISIIIVCGLTFVIVVGILNVVADLLMMKIHRPPSLADKYFQEELETEEWEVRQSRLGPTDVSTAG